MQQDSLKQNLPNLEKCELFLQMNTDAIFLLLKEVNYNIRSFNSEEMIFLEDNLCTNLGVVLTGAVEVKKIYSSGKVVVLTRLNKGNTFGEVLIFGTANDYPASIFALSQTTIMLIPKKEVITLCHENLLFMKNFLRILANKAHILNNKIHLLTFGNIRQKICYYLLEQYKMQKNQKISLPISKKKLAEEMGIQRPSLSRELIKLREEGLIDFSGKYIEIINLLEIERLCFDK